MASRQEPPPIDDEGLIYRERYLAGDRLGQTAIRWPDEQLLRRVEQVLSLGGQWGEQQRRAGPLRANEIVFIDTETTGLSRAAGTLAFLIGVGRFVEQPVAVSHDGAPQGDGDDAAAHLRVDQILLREPALEMQALDALQTMLATARVLVSFNGRSFDVPVLRNRAVLCRTALPLEQLPHIDLLPLCRRLFAARTLDCRLATMERQVLGFYRQDDVDGAEAPLIYAEFLHSGQWGRLGDVLEHNRLDVATMAPLLFDVADRLGEPLHWAEDAEELQAVALLHLKQGDAALAERCLERSLELARMPTTRRRVLATLARQRRRRGALEQSRELWELYRREFPQHNIGWIELAKHHEHVTRDLELALAFAEGAPHAEDDDVQHRLKRLRARLAHRAATTPST